MSMLSDIQTVMNEEFNIPNSKEQLIVGFKKIMMKPSERPWYLDYRSNCVVREANMNLTYG